MRKASMWPLEAWLAANGIPKSTFFYLKKNHPDRVPVTVAMRRKLYVTVEAETEFRERLLEEAKTKAQAGATEGPDSRGWITITPEGLLLTLRRLKENQTGQETRDVAVPFGRCPETCALDAVQAWLSRTGITGGRCSATFAAATTWGTTGWRPKTSRAASR